MSNELSIQIGDAKFKTLLSEAILASITTESRDALLKEALAKLVAPQFTGPSYDPQKTQEPSIVQREFGRAVNGIGCEVIAEMVKSDPEIRAKVETLVRDTLLALMEKPDAAGLIAGAIWGGIEKARY
jgi:hypothetical protein